MATYATQADFEAYVEGWVTTDPAALERLLERAERDIDDFIPGAVGTTGLKYDPTSLDAYTSGRLSDAVCAQAEYRLHWGEEFFILPNSVIKGGDYEFDGKPPKIAPKAKMALRAIALIPTTGRMT